MHVLRCATPVPRSALAALLEGRCTVSGHPNWAQTFLDHITKQLAVKEKAILLMSGMRAEVRKVGDSWLWTITHADADPTETSLAAGCETTSEIAAVNASEALSILLRDAAIP